MVADIADIKRKLKQLEHMNEVAFKALSGDAQNAVKKISDKYTKLGNVDIKPLKKGMEHLIGTTTTTSNVIKSTDGQLLKLTETTKTYAKKVAVLNAEGKKTGKYEIKAFQKVTTSVNNANNAISKYSKNTSHLIGKSSQLGTNFNNITDVNQKFATQLKGSGHAVKLLSSDIKQVSGNITKVGTTVKTADGKFLHLQETIQKTPYGLQTVARSATNVTKSYNKTAKASAKLTKNTVSLGENIKRLAKRAALTIPLWLAFRGTMMGVTRTIKDGLTNIAKMDKALQKARRNMSGSAQEITVNFAKLKVEATEMSLETGVAVEDIITAFQRFATTGQDFETSMAGARAATKLAVAQFGDTVGVADALARTYKILGDNIGDGVDKHKKLIKYAALIDELWKDNSFDINEFGQALERFASTADIFNVSMEDSIKLMATMHSATLVANRGGTMLSRTFLKIIPQLDKVSKVLGIDFNPEMDNAVSVLIKVVDAIGELRGSGKFKEIAETSKVLKELFAKREAIPIASLVSLRDLLKENFAMTGDVNKFNKAFNEVTETTGVLSDRFHNANKEIGKALVTGIVGGENFDDSLKDIVETLETIQSVSKGIGKYWARDLVRSLSAGGIGVVFLDIYNNINKSKKEVKNLKNEIDKALGGELTGIDLSKLLADLEKVNIFEFGGLEMYESITNELDKTAKRIKNQMHNAFKEGLSPDQLKKLAKDLEGVDFNILQMDKAKFDKFVSMVDDALVKVEDKVENANKKTRLVVGVDVSDFSLSDINKVNESIIGFNIERLRSMGALKSELLKQKSIFEDIYGIKLKGVELIDRSLEKERAISEEKRKQREIGNDTLKLLRITKEHGVPIAKKIGEVLLDKKKLPQFIKYGGEAAEIFKKEFSDVYEQAQATALFTGKTVPGEPKLRGGKQVPTLEFSERAIEEEKQRVELYYEYLRNKREKWQAQKPTVSQQELFVGKTGVLSTRTAPVNIQVPVNIGKIQLDMSELDKIGQQVTKDVKKQIANELNVNGTAVNTGMRAGMKDALYGKQVPTL